MKLNTILTILSFGILFSSCIVSEDFVLKKNKEVDYKLIIDGSELLSMMNAQSSESIADEPMFSSSEKMDTLIRVIDVVKDEVDSESLKGLEEDLKNIESLYYKVKTDLKAGIFVMELFGTFKNADTFNNAMTSLARLELTKGKDSEESDKKTQSKKELVAFFNTGRLSWDGKSAKYELGVASPTLEEDSSNYDLDSDADSEEDYDSALDEFDAELNEDLDYLDESMEELQEATRNPLAAFTKEVKITTVFHFPKEVKSVDLPEAGVFDSGKTVKIEHLRGASVTGTKEINMSTK